ncbi:MAG: restriction endonuclease [Rickettsiales bacterium]|jgi:restriction system protein|nr:restriction endonuclease [Rickettsiales bacterium]
MKTKNIPQSRQTIMKTTYAAFKILDENGGEMHYKALLEKLRATVKFTEWETQLLKGGMRWESIFSFSSIGYAKAGFIIKNKGVWFLTREGKNALKKGKEQLLIDINRGYKKWENNNYTEDITIEDIVNKVDIKEQQEIHIEKLEEQANSEIKEFIKGKNAYEFQSIVAALLRAMGYYTPFIAPRGKDGGIDIIAYSDPLGAIAPRLKVQIKHTESVSVEVVRSLTGILNSGGDVGLIVTSGKFTAEAERKAREGSIHIKLLNGDDFIELWQKFYAKMLDEDKNYIPLHSIYFLGHK